MTIEWKKTQPGSTEAVQFSDGMLVTAADLTAAMGYPLSVIQVLLKAYFGCGIVCGLDLTDPADTKGQRDPAPGKLTPPKHPPNFVLTVEKGVALGCDGYPVELCCPLKLDLTPDPCRPHPWSMTMFIAARRVTAAEASARPCGCGTTGGEPAQQCTRVRDHVLVQAFEDEPPADVCQVEASLENQNPDGTPAPGSEQQPTGAAAVCKCLKQCGECGCRGEPWVLLGSVLVGEQGLGPIDPSGRRYVKPIACICAASERDQVRPPSEVKKVEEKTTTKTDAATAAAE